MSYTIVIRDDAQTDTQEAYDHYKQQRAGLGEAFLMNLVARYDDLAKHPFHYSFIGGQPEPILRSVRITRFPYAVIFEIQQERVIVYAVHNTHKRQLV